MQTVLITGGTGLVGKALSNHLMERGYKVIILTRSANGKKNTDKISYAEWDVEKQTIDLKAVQSADIIIHLAGAGVIDKRWTDAYKKEILESRTKSSKLIVDSLAKSNHKVKTIVSSSAIGWYGPDKENGKAFVETDEHSHDFLGETCYAWEKSIEAASLLNIRVCKLRQGIVLSEEGGALSAFKKPVKFGVAAILGNGKQMISWIHIDDLCRMFIHAIENNAVEGSYNAVSPEPVSNKELTLTLAGAMKKNFIPMHVPAFVLKIVLGESSIEVLKSATVSSRKIETTGFRFSYPIINDAIKSLLK